MKPDTVSELQANKQDPIELSAIIKHLFLTLNSAPLLELVA